ncbi:MAG: hypothetical protein ABWZ77_03670, partial [Naasia sp.]
GDLLDRPREWRINDDRCRYCHSWPNSSIHKFPAMTVLLLLLAVLSLAGIARTLWEWRLDRRPAHLPPPGSRATSARYPTP